MKTKDVAKKLERSTSWVRRQSRILEIEKVKTGQRGYRIYSKQDFQMLFLVKLGLSPQEARQTVGRTFKAKDRNIAELLKNTVKTSSDQKSKMKKIDESIKSFILLIKLLKILTVALGALVVFLLINLIF